ncbi:MAG: hypothetical protein IKU33_00920 [Bacteroidales bacterium]|nr:hypothetical protein [Bacteroidales bacterium]
MEEVNLYVIGNLKGPRRQAGAGMYLLEAKTPKGAITREKIIKLEDTTENQLTLVMMDEALGRINRSVRLTIWLECLYVAGALREKWPEAWEKAGWTNSKGKPVHDAEKWQSVLGKIRLHETSVRSGEPHEYLNWMKRELEKSQSCTGATEGA